MYIKFYFYFSFFDLEVKVTELLKDILTFSGERHSMGFRKILVWKIVLQHVIKK